MKKKFHYLPKEEFRKRLVNLKEELDYFLPTECEMVSVGDNDEIPF